MKAYQLFQSITPKLATEIFKNLRDEQKDVYKSVLASLAQEKKLRPVFVQRKPVDQQFTWMATTCKLKLVDNIAEHILQLWLLKSQKELILTFLKALDIEHDEDGTVEDLPEELDEKKLKATVTKLLKKNDPEVLTLYLHVFQLQQADGWEPLAKMLESDDRLYLGEPPAPAAAEDSAEEEE